MRQNDDDFTPYQDRTLRWEKRARRPPLFESEKRATGPPQPGQGAGCARGCGCLLVIMLSMVALAYFALPMLPVHGRVFLLKSLVNSAIGETITVNNERVSVPDAWQEPWRSTTAVYGEAFVGGRVDRDHVDVVLWETVKTVLGGGGEIPAGEIWPLCEEMRAVLSPEDVSRLAPLPDRIDTAAPAGAAVPARLDVAPQESSLWTTLSVDERREQYAARRGLLQRLSTRRGPANARRLVPEAALIYDFASDATTLGQAMEEFAVDMPNPERMRVGRNERVGFSAPPSLAVRVAEGAKDAQAQVHFVTHASAVQFWYWFDGPALPGSSLEVHVDGMVVQTVEWPTSHLGAPDGPNWQQVHVLVLAATGPSRVELRVAVTGARRPVSLYIDDLVFTREGQD